MQDYWISNVTIIWNIIINNNINNLVFPLWNYYALVAYRVLKVLHENKNNWLDIDNFVDVPLTANDIKILVSVCENVLPYSEVASDYGKILISQHKIKYQD